MSASPPKGPAESPGWAAAEDRVGTLATYFLEQGDAYTAEALRAAARDAGFTPDEIDAAQSRAVGRRHETEIVRPIRTRARRIVLGAYGLVYAVLAAALLGSFGFAGAALVILTTVLGIALVISILWINTRGRSPAAIEGIFAAMLALPLILLIGVAGLCLATTRPFGAA